MRENYPPNLYLGWMVINYDTEIRNFFRNIIGSTEGVDHVLMEFKLKERYPGQRIVEKMTAPVTKALFVLLGLD